MQLLSGELIAQEHHYYLGKKLIKWICHWKYKSTNSKTTRESTVEIADKE